MYRDVNDTSSIFLFTKTGNVMTAVLFEKSTEMGRAGKAQRIRDFLSRFITIIQISLCL